MTVLDDATRRQIIAAEPEASTWVSANAGSGKTRVLTDRVARLLLRGVPPEKVLCLTYTKAAASEMQNRLFRRLGRWAMLADDTLRNELAELGAELPASPDALRNARRLFARAIEAPGGLKIQTIHSFCAALLRRFPLEAGVSPDFAEMDERSAKLMLEEIVEELADGPQAALVEDVARYSTDEDFATITAEITRHRERFAQTMTQDDCLRSLGLPVGFDQATLIGEVFLGGEAGLLADLVPLMAAGSKTGATTAVKLAEIDPDTAEIEAIAALEDIFLYKSGKAPFTAKIGDIPNKAVREGPAAPLMPALEALMLRIEAARPRRLGLLTAERTAALHAFAGPFLAAYEARKQARGWLDFDDLILRAARLLQQPGLAEWVLYRLDGGIDHILVDEAQDTSPAQWDVIRLIAEEFSAGISARSGVARTLFVVGDLKQSIYSFQGADPANFDRMAGHFGARLAEVDERLNRVELAHSFRSAPAILRVVDALFRPAEHHAGLGGPPTHQAFHEDKPGRVDLWPPVPKAVAEEDAPWYDPVDRIDPSHQDIVLARKIADEIARLCDPDTAETLPLSAKNGQPNRRPLRPGDFLILVQRRSTIFAELIRACKARNLPIAGADRLRLGGELAVKDLAALLAFLATPEDSLSLAAALKSPLFGWSEGQLYRLAHGRGDRYLWEVLREQDSAVSETLSVLNDLRREADFLRPYELLERILTRHDGRRKLISRLGAEAEDGIDALLSQAMAYERTDVPSLTGFIGWMQTEDVEVKRQLQSDGGVIRVMTVHGAKGLEAPVVILPDTRAPQGQDRGEVVLTPEEEPLWKGRAEEAPPLVADAVAERKARMAEERMRLLYVAMTRAESWLIVAGAGDMERGKGSWHGLVADALAHAGAVPLQTPTGEGWRFDTGALWGAGPVLAEAEAAKPKVALPDWAGQKAAPPVAPPEPLSPSDLGGAKALPGDLCEADLEAALGKGRRLHQLLEHLPTAPEADRVTMAQALLAASPDLASEEEIATLTGEALRVLADPAFAAIFTPEALCEVEIAADLPGLGRRIVGAIDRLIIRPDGVQVVDYKTNALVPDRPEDVPEGILRQMAAYSAALAAIYPGKSIRSAILWTSAPVLMPLPETLLAEALARVSLP